MTAPHQQARAGSPSSLFSEEWLAQHSEDILEPALPIVDAHHHLWAPDGAPRYSFDEILADVSSGHNVVATVFVQCHSMYRADGPEELRPVGETEFVNGVGARSTSGRYGKTRICAGIVGYADLRLGAKVASVLEAHLQAASGRFRGIRQVAMWDPEPSLFLPGYSVGPGLLADPKFREGFGCLLPLGLSFDACAYHTQLPEVIQLARAFPETRIIVNHVGLPLGVGKYAGCRGEVFAVWRQAIRELATCQNVVIKLGGLGTRYFGFAFNERPIPPSSEELANVWRPYIETCVDAFTPERAMFESNFPPDKASCSYAVLWNSFKRVASGYSTQAKERLFAGTAMEVYQLGRG